MGMIGVVIGMGEFGFHLAKSLSRDGCEVIAVDRDKEKIDRIKEFVQNAIVADVRSPQVLEHIIPNDADFVVVAVGDIESSLISTLLIKEMQVKKIHVKAANEEHERILKLLGVHDIIFPEKNMAERVSARLVANNMLDYLPLTADYSIAEVPPAAGMEGKSIRDIDFRKKYDLSIIGVRELVPPRTIFSPDAAFVIKMSDILIVLGKKASLENYNKR